MQKKSFEELRDLVTKKYQQLDNCPWDYLNEKGQFMHDVYDELDSCFFDADSLEDYVQNARDCINSLLTPMYYWSPERKENNAKVAEKVRKFVRWQIANELWENIPEFQNRKEN